jgi:hypothetical protein
VHALLLTPLHRNDINIMLFALNHKVGKNSLQPSF